MGSGNVALLMLFVLFCFVFAKSSFPNLLTIGKITGTINVGCEGSYLDKVLNWSLNLRKHIKMSGWCGGVCMLSL